jgi:phosphoglycerol transferase MdoB-like AlkP superfamily enzyme
MCIFLEIQISYKFTSLFCGMNLSLSYAKNRREGLVFLLFALLVVISVLTRVLLTFKTSAQIDFGVLTYAEVTFIGLFYDIVTAVYFCLPFVIYLWLIPQRIYAWPGHIYILYGWFSVLIFILIFNGIAEWLFWDEFSARFNFIAVDYLVYTTEVIGNIRQSYPIEWIIVGVVGVTGAIAFGVRSWIRNSSVQYVCFKNRTVEFALYIGILVASLLIVNSKLHHFARNAFANELAGNGIYELFAAYRHNELDYERFYSSVETTDAFSLVRDRVKTKEAEFTNNNPYSITRAIHHAGPAKDWNVVLISVESFSADFMKHFGNSEGITPFLDSLADHSLLFTNLYATGTRTVRGLEALSLCVPPTPGQSIVRRPNNEGLFSLASVFNEKGYHSQFIYGGYSYFDNMGYFFENNGYAITDRSALKDEEIDYENIWGVADENLFELAIREMDANTAHHKVFSHIMTTSNHRPYTYPDGRIDIPSHTSRRGAVKYTDYSIGKFIREASKKPWFANTVFVIVADHCASSAGKTDLPVDKYHIPLLIYSPGNIAPGTMDRLMSQIDVGPTVLGLLNFSYVSNFYGFDMFQLEPGRERAFVSTYQSLGYIRQGELVILSPQAKAETFQLSPDNDVVRAVADDSLTKEAIAWYECASYSFKNGLMKATLH